MKRACPHRLFRLCIGFSLLLAPLVAFALVQYLAAPVEVVQAAPLYQTAPTISFSSLTYSQVESAGSASISVQISGAMTAPTATVQFLTVPGTAVPGVDYIHTSGVLTFTTSPATQSFTVTIINDNVHEPDKTVNLVLRNPVNATLGAISTATLTIIDDDPPPTVTPTPTTGAPPVFLDAYEPNNSLQEAHTTAADAPALCNITLWPTGDVDFFRFSGKAGSHYEVLTTNLSAGLDTVLTVFNTSGGEIATNDDYQTTSRASRVVFRADVAGFYYARIVNQDPTDPTNKTYCFEVNEMAPPTPTASPTPIPGDVCEFNSTFDTACLIGLDQTLSLSFVPVFGSEQDTDVFRLWVKPDITYTCETHNLSPVTDTNMILFDHNRQGLWIGNEDKELGDYGSRVSYMPNYTGWLYIMVGPVNVPLYEESYLYTYQLTCTSTVATPTPTATPVPAAPPAVGVPGVPQPTAVIPTFEPTPTPIDLSLFFTPTPMPPPLIQFQPLPTSTPAAGARQTATINVTLYYDSNFNYVPELTEGIRDVAVALYDNATGQLIAFGYTNEAGMVRFDSVTASGAVRVVVPFLNYSQIVVGASANILLRVAPQPLPIGIP